MADAKVKAVITAEDRASHTLRNFGGTIDNATKKTSLLNRGFKALAAVGMAAVVAASAAVGFAIAKNIGAAVKRIDTLVAFPRVLQAMGFSADAATKSMERLDKGLRGLPTPIQEGTKGVQELVAAGLGVDKATRAFLGLNNALLASSADAQDTQIVMQGLTRAISAGKANASTMQAVMSRMPTVMKALANETGKSQAELFKLFSEDPQKLIDSLIRLNEKGGGGLASLEEQARAATGGIGTAFDNMNNAITRGLESIVKAIGGGGDLEALARGQEKIAGVITNVGKVFENVLGKIGESIKLNAEGIDDFIDGLVRTAQTIGDFLLPKVKELIDNLLEFWKEVIQPLIPVIGVTLVVAIATLIDILNAVLPVLSNNKEAIYLLIGAIVLWKTTMAIGTVIASFRAGMAAATASTNLLTGAFAASKLGYAGFLGFLAANPITIVVGAAIAALLLLRSEIAKTKSALDNLQASRDQRPDLDTYLATYNEIKRTRGLEAAQRYARSQNRQHGGPITAGQPYLVGEAGPELIVPRQSGTVIPNNKLESGRGGTTNISLNVNVGMFAGSAIERRKIAEILFNDLKDVAAKYGMSLSEKVARA